MEYTKHIDYIDTKYGTTMKKKVIYTLPLKVHDLVVQSIGESEGLKQKLLGLKLKRINQYLSYDPKDIFGKKLRSQSFELQSRC